MNTIIQCNNVSKAFINNKKKLPILTNISFSINANEFIVIGGENGSGKSTLLKILIGLLLPDTGNVQVLEFDMATKWKAASSHIGVALANERSLYWKLNAVENLEIFSGLYDVKRKEYKTLIPFLLDKVGLKNFDKMPVENYSTGMRRKLLLCKAIIHTPKILFADELLSGLDPKTTVEIVEFLKELQNNGMTIVLVSHSFHALPHNTRLLLIKDGVLFIDESLSNFRFGSYIKISYTENSVELSKTIQKEELGDEISLLVKKGAIINHIEQDDVYSVINKLILNNTNKEK